ncbi:MAG: hypothetical protein ACSLFQ_14570 [Thermoanaerobaculia bacterium]
MKKVLFVVALIVAVVILTYTIVIVLADSGREEIAERWRTLESDEAHAVKYPAVPEKNEAAAKLEAAAIPLGISMTPRVESERLGEVTVNSKEFDEFKRAVTDWTTEVIESVDDGIAPLPPGVGEYLRAHRAEIDAIAELIATEGTPLWPMHVEGYAQLRPLPNLLGQMNLGRVLAAASLEAQLAGEPARAWRYQQAQWSVAKGSLSRPEVISQLIGIALARRVAGLGRKLDGPAPEWFAEMERFDFHRAMLDACRGEWTGTSEATFDDSFLEELRASAQSEHANLFRIVGSLAARPFVAWGITAMERVTVEELLRLEKADPCSIDSQAISAAMDARIQPLAKKLGGDFLPSTHAALSRAASVEIAIEGTSKIVALKSRRDAASRVWPAAADDLAASRCSDARWNYARTADGSVHFAFDGKVDRPSGYQGYWVPLEYRAK